MAEKKTETSNVYDADPNKLIELAAAELKKDKNIQPPEWSAYVKTGAHKERIPKERDWWYTRTAAILRRIYIHPQGVSRLRREYGGRKNRGYKPEKFCLGSGSIPRKALQQLEKAGFVKKEKNGRVITENGSKFLEGVAGKVKA